MRLSLSPLSGRHSVIWAISWFSVATILTFALWWPVFQYIPFSAYFAAVALIATRSGARWGIASALGAVGLMAYTGFFAPGFALDQIVIRSASIIMNSFLVIWLGARLRRDFRENAAYQTGISEAVSDFVWTTTADLATVFLNKRGEEYFGYTLERLRREGWRGLVHEDDMELTLQAFQKAIRERQPVGYESRLRRHDGVYVWFNSRLAPILNEQGEAVQIVGTSTNIEDRKRIEAERESSLLAERAARAEAERANRAKDEFLSTLSHELRTPLNAIMGWVYIAQNEQLAGAELEEAMGIVDRNARAQLRLIEDLLEMSRVITGKLRLHMEHVDLSEVIETSVQALRTSADAKNIVLTTSLPEGAAVVHGDPDRMQQVLWNLLNNAIKFTPIGGRVEVALRCVVNRAEFTVTDNGIGIESGVLPFIFERFRQGDSSSTRNYEGLGLGLAIVKELVDLQGGTVTASSPGTNQGAVFRVAFPLAADAPEAITPRKPAPAIAEVVAAAAVESEEPFNPEPALQSLRVLVVDDDEGVRDLVSRILQRHGADVSTAGSAQEALETMREIHFETLVSDVGMPIEDGCTFIRRVRKLEPQQGGRIPAIALTAFARSDERVRAIKAGFDVFLSKPVDAAELIALVERCAVRA